MKEHDYFQLTPEVVLQAIENFGLTVNSQILTLNSYENRVYRVGLNDGEQVIIAKFYRPNRWSNEEIQEEHDFTEELAQNELPIIAPIRNKNGLSLHTYNEFRFALYPCVGGRAPEPGHLDQMYRIGLLLGRIHASGKQNPFQHRPYISVDTHCLEPARTIKSLNFLDDHLKKYYDLIISEIAKKIQFIFKQLEDIQYQRIHGDCHLGNILWSESQGASFLDFDDSRMGPVIQDLWMLLTGDRTEQSVQLSEIIEGYNQFNDFPKEELILIESLRTLRIIYTAGWLAKRWNDPSFPINFPWFNSSTYWEQHINELKMQFELLDEIPFTV